MAQNRKKGMAKRALSVSLVAAMLATSNTPAWASGFMNENEDGVQAFFDEMSSEAVQNDVILRTANVFGKNTITGTTVKGTDGTYTLELADDSADEALTIAPNRTTEGNNGTAWFALVQEVGEEKTLLGTAPVAADEVPNAATVQAKSLAGKGEVSFSVYTHTESITAENLADATIVSESTATIKVTVAPSGPQTGNLSDYVIKWKGFDKDVTPSYTYDKNHGEYCPEIEKIYKAATPTVEYKPEKIEYTYTSNKGVGKGKATVTVTDADGATTFDVDFEIKAVEFNTVTAPEKMMYTTAPEKGVTRDELLKTIVVTDKNGATLTPQAADGSNDATADYRVEFEGGAAVDTYETVTISGVNNYADARNVATKKILVEKRDISAFTVSKIADMEWDGGAQEPVAGTDFDVAWNIGKKSNLTTTDYDVEYKDQYNVGTATVTIKGKGSYTGTMTATYNIVAGKTEFTDAFKTAVENDIAGADDGKWAYTGKEIMPVKPGYTGMVLGTDYTVTYSPAKPVDVNRKVKVTVNGLGKYKSAEPIESTFEITPVALERVVGAEKDALKIADVAYTEGMTSAKPAVTLTYKGMTLVQGRDYIVIYPRKNVDLTAKTVSIGLSVPTDTGNYTVTGVSGVYTVTGKLISKEIKNVSIPSIPAQPLLDNAGVVKAYTINDIKLDEKTFFVDSLKDGNKKLVLGTDFYVKKLVNSDKVGTATLTLGGQGNYTGEVDLTFSVVDQEITAVIYNTNGGTDLNAAGLPATTYKNSEATSKTGILYQNAATAELVKNSIKVVDPKTAAAIDGSKYNVEFKNNTQAGTASIIVKGKPGFNIYAESTFKISPQRITTPAVTFENGKNDFVYTGTEIKPVLDKAFAPKDINNVYELKKDVDYEITYKDNINVTTTAKVIVKGKGNYVFGDDTNTGLTKDFTITQAVITKENIVAADVPYAGGAEVAYSITVKSPATGEALVQGTDYTITLDNKTNVGTSIATLELIGAAEKNYAFANGCNPVAFRILPKSLADCDAKVIAGKVVIKNGEITVPETEYTVVENEDGTFTVTAKADENYTGTITVSPVVAPEATQAKVADKTTNSVKVAWDAVEGAEGYTIWYHSEKDTTNARKILTGGDVTSWTQKGLAAGTKYFYTVKAWVKDAEGKYVFGEETSYVRGTTMPMKAKITKVTANGGMVKVALADNAAGAEKYSMCYSKSSDFASFKVGVRTSYTTRTFTNALAKGTYYVRVKSYRDLNGGKRIYGAWSNTVKVVVK